MYKFGGGPDQKINKNKLMYITQKDKVEQDT